jgi:hypothetical protein
MLQPSVPTLTTHANAAFGAHTYAVIVCNFPSVRRMFATFHLCGVCLQLSICAAYVCNFPSVRRMSATFLLVHASMRPNVYKWTKLVQYWLRPIQH